MAIKDSSIGQNVTWRRCTRDDLWEEGRREAVRRRDDDLNLI
jgi:hypothetical protein